MHDGFTFVELIIAATIFSVLVTGLTSHLRGGGIVWRRTTETVEALQRQRAALDQVARDLGNAVIYDTNQEAYGTEAPKPPLPRFAPDGMDWFTVSLSLSRSALPSIRFVTYRCEELDGVQGLWRTSQSVGEARARQATPVPELVLEGCRGLSLRYAYAPVVDDGQPLEWRPQWPGGSGGTLQLPRLVEVTARMESGQVLQRVAAVPAGVLTASE
ncbi:MAG: type II secretion system protein GspJ [Candidatus Omnitrophota bacterium]|nr:type II secretion system protein GspJ [Candidatus Omnitrophota bacterium]